MGKSAASLKSELGASVNPLVMALLIFGPLLVISQRLGLQVLAMLCCLVAVAVWLLDRWRPRIGRWFAILALLGMVHLASVWLRMPGILVLSAIPIALAPSLISLPAATAAAIGESLVLVTLWAVPTTGSDSASLAVALIAIWATLGSMYTAYRPMHRLIGWLDEYFEDARRSVEEAQDRQADLELATERLRHAGRQLALANERMADLRAIAEEARRAQTAFVSNVSHEFRTPLNMIIGLVELIMETPETYYVVLSPGMREDLEVIHRNCEYLSSLVDDVLDLTRMEAGRATLMRERVDLRGIIQDSVEAVRPLLRKKGLALTCQVSDDLPHVFCDRTRIQQVILNLVSNATRFTDEGGIAIEVAQREADVLVSVRDTGTGIPPDDRDRIFEPFYQSITGDEPRHREGSGLGLSVSRQFVQMHGGAMWLESELGSGTTFYFTLPISVPLEHTAHPGRWIREDWVWREQTFRAGQEILAAELANPRIVICDESDALYPQFVRYSDKIEFVDTKDIRQLTDELQQSTARAIVVNSTDAQSLLSLVEAVKQEVPDTPIVGCSVPRQAKRALDAGAAGYLVKPVTRSDLQDAVNSLGRRVERVLVVEDDPDASRLFSRMLRLCDSNLEVRTASSGLQALDEVQRTPPDLVLLDVMLPDMDGWQVLERMKQTDATNGIPTYFVSATDPADQPSASSLLLATIGGGVSLGRLLQCSLDISGRMLKPEPEVDLALA
jgi:signal transduction histidine kinase/CheY-like chemotaxis protein